MTMITFQGYPDLGTQEMDSQLVLSKLKFKAGDCITVTGTVDPEAKAFALNVGQDASNLILHFNARFHSHGEIKTIVCNSMADGKWGEEQREHQFPFQQGKEAQISISFNAQEVTVELRGGQEIKFPNNLGLESAEFLSVDGDFRVTSVHFG
ncbi:hypothetical protein lerEdw1_013113 [Lerista edwardsae]|nr:hypothetical protein lerEdw1_013113 [Lerista edwardsae]